MSQSQSRTRLRANHPTTPPVDELLSTARVIVCAGTGGVGKTTTAAALGIAAADLGRRVVVVTVDPARRLAEALGLGAAGLSNEPQPVDVSLRSATRRPKALDASDATDTAITHGTTGELWAMMLDARATFDTLVATYSKDDAQRERIVANRFYANISGALSGTQDYMAAETLHRLHADERFDLVIVDTPPTRSAVDFLDAPGRLVRFLDHRLYRALSTPARFSARIANVAVQSVTKVIGRIIGGDVLDDVVAFFAAFNGMEAGFRQRAAAVASLLGEPSTAYVIVASPRTDTVAEAIFFVGALQQRNRSVALVVVNRMHPDFGVGPDHDSRSGGSDRSPLDVNLAELRHVAAAERVACAPLLAAVEPDTCRAYVTLFDGDVTSIDALRSIGASIRRHVP